MYSVAESCFNDSRLSFLDHNTQYNVINCIFNFKNPKIVGFKRFSDRPPISFVNIFTQESLVISRQKRIFWQVLSYERRFV